jgi:phosphate transport system substrate-binding protein
MLPLAALLVAVVGAADPAPLPDYAPREKISGVIRTRGNPAMAAVLRAWQEGFARHHPEARFADSLKSTAAGIYGLDQRTADLAVMGRAMIPFERYGVFERSWMYPVEIQVATGGVTGPGRSPALAVFVHRDNPLTRLTLRQLDGIYGAERDGGWHALSWDTAAARPADRNLRVWGQLGVGGALAGRAIRVYGPPLPGAGAVSFFQARVLQGGDKWNEDYREYPDPARMLADLARDPAGIAFAPLDFANADVRAQALAEGEGGPFVLPEAATVADRSYPLSRPVYLVFTIDNERSDPASPRVAPKVREFLRYVLSRQGQADVAREGSYLPLPAAVARTQWKKLESEALPPEREY